MIFIKPKKEKKEEFTSSFSYIVEIQICRFYHWKNLNVFLHQELQLNLELFHTSIRKETKQNKNPEKINYKLIGCRDSKDFLQRPVQHHTKGGDVWQEIK